ncbi:unnamed protein product [Candida parapsilosis]
MTEADSLLKQGEELYKSGKIAQEDAKDAFHAFSKGDNFQIGAKEAQETEPNNDNDDKDESK